jgi:threonine/homoserine/homoserine lactone efflux protein
MDFSQQLIQYLTALICLSVYPGPTVLGVISLAIQNNLTSSFLFIGGILAANTVFAFFATLVKSIGFALPPPMQAFLVMIGSMGLFYLSGKLLYSVYSSSRNGVQSCASGARIDSMRHDWFLTGFIHHISNPNTVTFFISIFLSIAPLDDNFLSKAFLLGFFAVLVDAVVLATFSLLFSTGSSIAFSESHIVHKFPILASLSIFFLGRNRGRTTVLV